MKDAPSVTSVAVLPFVDFCDDPRSKRIGDGFREMLAANLACLPSLHVVMRTRDAQGKRGQGHLAAIAGGHASVVKGFLFPSSTQLRIAVGLFDAVTGALLLTRSYVGQVATLQYVQAAIAYTVAGEIETALRQRSAPLQVRAG